MNDLIKPDFNKEQKFRTKGFVLSVFQMFPDYNEQMKDEENIRAYCRMYVKDIVTFDQSNYDERLEKVKKLVAVQNLSGLIGNYRNSIHALSAACGSMEKLNHDYRVAYPSHQGGTGALEHIKENKSDLTHEEQIERAKGLTGLFKK